MVERHFHVYILSSFNQAIYIGVTGDLVRRVAQHEDKLYADSHTAKYHIDRLVYLEEFTDVRNALEHEKQIKVWRREKKVRLIAVSNPTWKDLSQEW